MIKATTQKDPFIRVVRRSDIPTWKSWLFRIIAILAAFALVNIFVFAMTKATPLEVCTLMFQGTFGNIFFAKGSIFLIAKLLLIAVALAPAFKMKFWNIGAEGQVLAGAMITAFLMVKFSDLPNHILIPLMIVSAIIAGAIWGVIPAIFKAQWGVNETLFTLMMNYVAMQIVDFFFNSWKGQKASLGILNATSHKGWLPQFSDINWVVVITVLFITVLMYIYLKFTKQGYEIAVVGESVNTAKYAGISVKKTIIRTMIISGAIAGIAGFLTVAGEDHSVTRDTAGGYGFTAIIVAWLAKFNTLWMILIATLVIFLEQGTKNITNVYQSVGFDASASKIVIGIVLFFIIGSEFFINYKLIRRRSGKEA